MSDKLAIGIDIGGIILAILFLGESLSGIESAGILLAIGGTLLLCYEKKQAVIILYYYY